MAYFIQKTGTAYFVQKTGTAHFIQKTGMAYFIQKTGMAHLVLDIHLIKLINAADAIVSQHQGSSLNGVLVAVSLSHNRRRQAGCAAALASGVDSPWQKVRNKLENLQRMTHNEMAA
jgi:hypothetical protein